MRNIEVLWLLNRVSPCFMTISDFRKAHPKAIVGVCRQFTAFCQQQALFGSQLAAIDGSKIQAVASRKQVVNPERIAREQAAIEARIQQFLAQLDAGDVEEDVLDLSQPEAVAAALQQLRERHGRLQELATELNAQGLKQRVEGEPDARLMHTVQGKKVAYNAQIAVDAEHHLIVHAEVTNDGNDHAQLQPMAEAAKAVLAVETLTVVADTGYANGEQARGCTGSGITPCVPRPELVNPKHKGGFTRLQFTYDAATDTYCCPAEQILCRKSRGKKAQVAKYWNKQACRGCPLKAQCTTSVYRTIVRSDFEDDLQAMHQRTVDDASWMMARRCTVEHPFGTMKWMMGMPRFLVRGLEKVRGEFALCVLGYNLKRVMAILGVPELVRRLRESGNRRPLPA